MWLDTIKTYEILHDVENWKFKWLDENIFDECECKLLVDTNGLFPWMWKWPSELNRLEFRLINPLWWAKDKDKGGGDENEDEDVLLWWWLFLL